jgi:hypothetical protein
MDRDRTVAALEAAAACATLLRGTIDNTAIATTEMDGDYWGAIHWIASS